MFYRFALALLFLKNIFQMQPLSIEEQLKLPKHRILNENLICVKCLPVYNMAVNNIKDY